MGSDCERRNPILNNQNNCLKWKKTKYMARKMIPNIYPNILAQFPLKSVQNSIVQFNYTWCHLYTNIRCRRLIYLFSMFTVVLHLELMRKWLRDGGG